MCLCGPKHIVALTIRRPLCCSTAAFLARKEMMIVPCMKESMQATLTTLSSLPPFSLCTIYNQISGTTYTPTPLFLTLAPHIFTQRKKPHSPTRPPKAHPQPTHPTSTENPPSCTFNHSHTHQSKTPSVPTVGDAAPLWLALGTLLFVFRRCPRIPTMLRRRTAVLREDLREGC